MGADEELKPCAHCGSTWHALYGAARQYVRCQRCEAQGPVADGRAAARAAWNLLNPLARPAGCGVGWRGCGGADARALKWQ
jgi:hypothetical protein